MVGMFIKNIHKKKLNFYELKVSKRKVFILLKKGGTFSFSTSKWPNTIKYP
jgi:hypothetical protein